MYLDLKNKFQKMNRIKFFSVVSLMMLSTTPAMASCPSGWSLADRKIVAKFEIKFLDEPKENYRLCKSIDYPESHNKRDGYGILKSGKFQCENITLGGDYWTLRTDGKYTLPIQPKDPSLSPVVFTFPKDYGYEMNPKSNQTMGYLPPNSKDWEVESNKFDCKESSEKIQTCSSFKSKEKIYVNKQTPKIVQSKMTQGSISKCKPIELEF